jgi:hypothetical protein
MPDKKLSHPSAAASIVLLLAAAIMFSFGIIVLLF